MKSVQLLAFEVSDPFHHLHYSVGVHQVEELCAFSVADMAQVYHALDSVAKGVHRTALNCRRSNGQGIRSQWGGGGGGGRNRSKPWKGWNRGWSHRRTAGHGQASQLFTKGWDEGWSHGHGGKREVSQLVAERVGGRERGEPTSRRKGGGKGER